MDIPELIKIAIPMVIGIVLKEVIGWIWSIIKTTVSAMNVVAKIKIIFSKRNRKVLLDILLILFYSGLLIKLSTDDGSASRLETLLMIGCVLFILFTLVGVLWDLSQQSHERERAKLKQPK